MKKKIAVLLFIPFLFFSCDWIKEIKDLFTSSTGIKDMVSKMLPIGDMAENVNIFGKGVDLNPADGASLGFTFGDSIMAALQESNLFSMLNIRRSLDLTGNINFAIADEVVNLPDERGSFKINDLRVKAAFDYGFAERNLDFTLAELDKFLLNNLNGKINLSCFIDLTIDELDFMEAEIEKPTKIANGFVKGEINLTLASKSDKLDMKKINAFIEALTEDPEEGFEMVKELAAELDAVVEFAWGGLLQMGGYIVYEEEGELVGGRMLNQIKLKPIKTPVAINLKDIFVSLVDKEGNFVWENEAFYEGYADEMGAIYDFILNKIIAAKLYQKENTEWFTNEIRVYGDDVNKPEYEARFTNLEYADMQGFIENFQDKYIDMGPANGWGDEP